jgi:hypothetical protein
MEKQGYLAMELFSKGPKDYETHQMVEGSSDRMEVPRPWEDRSRSPEERYASYKTVAREYVSRIREAMLREGVTEDERTEIRLHPDTQFWVQELKQLLKESADEFCSRIAIPSFLSRYKVRVINDHTVSFVIPEGVSRIDILNEAQRLVQERDERDLIYPDQLEKWKQDEHFTNSVITSEEICIDGHVKGGGAKDRAAQEKFVADKGLVLANVEDLAVAFALHWVATGQPLFGWLNQSMGWCYVVRGVGGSLNFRRDGLSADNESGYEAYGNIAVSARVSPESK